MDEPDRPQGPAPAGTAQERDLHEKAEVAGEFLLGVTRLARDLKLPQDAAVALFGLFARKCIDARVKAGVAREAATMDLMRAFMTGMGMDIEIEQAGDAGDAVQGRHRGPLQ